MKNVRQHNFLISKICLSAMLCLSAATATAQSLGWKYSENNNSVIAAQKAGGTPAAAGDVKLDFFGHQAFRITSPKGVSILIDPWRNDPSGFWGVWFGAEFPPIYVDAVLSTHAHFDHDAVEKPHAAMVLERMAGQFQLGDVAITGHADKHQCHAPGYLKWSDLAPDNGFCPPKNPMHMDNVIYIVETGGLRIAHWGDNRPEPDERVLKDLEGVDVLIMNIDGSDHILSDAQVNALLKRIKPRVIIPSHYLQKGVTTEVSALLKADDWVKRQGNTTYLTSGNLVLNPAKVKKMNGAVMYFGANYVKN